MILPLAVRDRRAAALAATYFFLSTVITWWFIVAGESLYHDRSRMLLSCSVAGAKWGIQILAALVFLDEKRWPFLAQIGATCLVGSAILLPFCFAPVRAWLGSSGFLASLIVAVLTMLVLYFFSVRRIGLKLRWFFGWVLCLAVAVTLQLTVVFHVV